jgi:glycosyltransferase Alg8
VVASVVEGADARLIRTIFAQMRVDMTGVNLMLDQIAGTGKRDALAKGLRMIAGQAPSWRDIVIFVDGDSCVPEDIVAQSAPWFSDTSIGALTTDEAAEITDAPTFRDWFDLRFTQRHVLMSSMALAGRVLTLTGRMSVFRADLATDPGFIAQVHSDHLQHWRLGRVNFLTGDDKSTWFWLLKSGYRMLYLPDVRTLSMERQPLPGFVASATTLMVRWYGNMMRTNGRALALPATRIGAFTWWSLLDQRITIWTTLAGPLGILLTMAFTGPGILVAYLAWVMFTRYVFCLALALFRGSAFPISYPFLLYFGQIMGAAVKSFVLFRLDRQRWTRQASGARRAGGASDRVSTLLHVLALGWLTLGVTFFSGLL